MPIFKDDQTESYENLVISEINKYSYNIFIVSYNFSKEDLYNQNHNLPVVDLIKKTSIQIFNNNKSISVKSNTPVINSIMGLVKFDDCTCGYFDHATESTGGDITMYFIVAPCSSSGGGNTSGGISTGGGTGYVPYYGGSGMPYGTSNGYPPDYNGSNYVIVITEPVIVLKTSNQIEIALKITLNSSQLAWWNNSINKTTTASIITFLTENQIHDVDYDIDVAIKNAINYLMTHSNVTFLQYQNWFMGQSEGEDLTYDSAYWNNPNLTFPQQNLPTYIDYYNGMPRFTNGTLMTGADNVYGLVGGAVQQKRLQYPGLTNNTCALKVSIALNRSGVIIPNLPGKTVEGGGTEFTGKYFFLNARSLNSWMRETFGTNSSTNATPCNVNHISYTGSQGGVNGSNFPNLLNNITGIYSMITTESYSNSGGATGHADLIFPSANNNLATCVFGCFFNLPIERIDVWLLN